MKMLGYQILSENFEMKEIRNPIPSKKSGGPLYIHGGKIYQLIEDIDNEAWRLKILSLKFED